MKTTISAFSPVDILLTDEEIAAYLMDAFDDDDPEVFVIALCHVVNKYGIVELSQQTGLDRDTLYAAFNGTVKPGWDTIHRIMTALGIKLAAAA